MAHKGQFRKLSNEPYISHPIRVAKQLEKHAAHEELVCAGYLHDVVEDSDLTLYDITEYFGERVATLVAANTEDKSLSWRERKQDTIDVMGSASVDVRALIVADKLDNLLDIQAALERMGNAVWDHFNAPKDEQRWYFSSIADVMYDHLDEDELPAFFKAYEQLVKEVFH